MTYQILGAYVVEPNCERVPDLPVAAVFRSLLKSYIGRERASKQSGVREPRRFFKTKLLRTDSEVLEEGEGSSV